MYGCCRSTAGLTTSVSGCSEVSVAITEMRSPLSFDFGVELNQPETVSETPPNVSQPESARTHARQKSGRNKGNFIEPARLPGDSPTPIPAQVCFRERSRNLRLLPL